MPSRLLPRNDLDPATALAIFLCDRFSSYKKMAKDMVMFILAFCWAHVRRDFIKAARSCPDEKEWMFEWVEQIGGLYHINNQRRDLWDASKPLQQQSEAFMEQHHWMTLFLTACAQNGSKCPDDLTPFLPWAMTDERKVLLSRPLPPKPPPDAS